MHPPILLFFPSKGGGVQHGQILLANTLAKRGAKVMCVMPVARGPFLSRLAPGVPLIDLRTRHPTLATARLARLLRRCRPRAVIASQTFGVNTAVAARVVAAVDVPIVAVQHNVISELCRNGSALCRAVLPRLSRLCYPLADRLVAVSQGAAEDLAAMTGVPAEDISVIPCTTVTPEIQTLAKVPTGQPWVDAKTVPVILAAGNLRAVKDYPTLIRAFALLRRARPARLVIIGEGEERARLEALARELGVTQDLHMPGHVENPFAYMARADALALSSKHEGFGNALIEAMACGCQIVATDCPHGPREILQQGRYGHLVPVGAEVAMAQALADILDTPVSDAAELRRRAADFSLERAASRYLALIDDCAGAPGHLEAAEA